MLLHHLGADEQRTFCHAVQLVVAADERLHAREEEIQKSLLRELDLQRFPNDGEPLAQVIEAVRGFPGDVANIFLLELAGVATADFELDPKEREILESLAAAMDVSLAQLDGFIELAQRAHELYDEARVAVALRPSGNPKRQRLTSASRIS